MIQSKKVKSRKAYNGDLPFVVSHWNGNPMDHKNRYVNLNEASEKGFKHVFAWKMKGNEFKVDKKKQYTNVEVVKNDEFIQDKSDGFTWLGHATFFFTLDGKKIIVDPVLQKVGPLKRHTPLPCDANELKGIDLILLSHNHRDHLDKKSFKLICKQNPKAIIYTGLEIGGLLKKWGLKNDIVEAGWYQKYPPIDQLQITYLPSKHWNRRGLTDLNEMLWGSFMIESSKHTLYFGADSGIDHHFTQIGALFPRIDYAFIGIGAYEPNWFMRPSHTNPKEALEAFQMLNAKKMVPMHYGTFDLSDEPLNAPKETLMDLLEKSDKEKVLFLKIGEKLLISELAN
jgi:L-ascorbate metabolism protein UlaG (beta-lactamase superfamily)